MNQIKNIILLDPLVCTVILQPQNQGRGCYAYMYIDAQSNMATVAALVYQ